MAISISRIVQDLIDKDISIQHALEKGYGNYSAIARMLKPMVEEMLGKKVKLESVITAVKRARVTYKPAYHLDVTSVIADSTINLRTDVAKISIEKTKRNMDTVRKMLTGFSQDEYVQIVEGMRTLTLIFDQKLIERIKSNFSLENVLGEKNNLVAIIITSPQKIVETPGCITSFYNALSRLHINIEETLSCSTETIMVLQLKDVGKALAALTNVISEARKMMEKLKSSRNSRLQVKGND
jgi:aspartokinase